MRGKKGPSGSLDFVSHIFQVTPKLKCFLYFRSLLSIVKEKDISNLSPYTGGRPDIFGSYVSEFMGLTDPSTEKEDWIVDSEASISCTKDIEYSSFFEELSGLESSFTFTERKILSPITIILSWSSQFLINL